MPRKVDTLFTNAHVLTMNKAMEQFERGAVAVDGDSIIAVGPQDEITKEYTGSKAIDCGGKVLMPGLINAHTHVPMTLLRGLADDLRLDVWLLGYMMPVEREFVSPEFVQLGTKIACAEFIRTGITAFADMYYYEEDVAKATAEAGLRGWVSETVLKYPTPDAPSFEDALEYTRGFMERWKDHPLIVPGIAPHAPYTSTEEILRKSSELAQEFDVPLHIHISETAQEVENMREEHDMPVVPYVKKMDIFDAKTTAAHCVHIDSGEIHTLFNHGVGVAHNPSSNMKLSSGAAPVAKMLELGLNVGIGTDGPASNNDLDMFEEIRLASFLGKHSTGDPTALPAADVVLMATRMGAEAIHMGDITGSLESGKRADLILVDIHTTHNSPHFRRDPHAVYAQLVYAGKATDVSDVMVNGQWLMQDRELLTLNETKLLAEAQVYAEKIDAFLIEREQSVLSKLIAIGGAAEAESFEVQVKVRIQDPKPVIEALNSAEFDIKYHRRYHEYDTYFDFEEGAETNLRYREDEFINAAGEIENVRYRLTLVGDPEELKLPQDVGLSRSRFLAPATHSLRFYREYFRPSNEYEVEKDRLRWLVEYRGIEYYVNIDHLSKPELGYFLEVKSRTWSRKDAEQKAQWIADMVKVLGASPDEVVREDYYQLVRSL